MKNWNRIAVFVGLTLLVVALTIFLPRLDFFDFLRPLRHGFPWVTFAIIWVIFWCCCGGRGCCRRRSRREEDVTEAKL